MDYAEVRRLSYLRRFSPTFLESLAFVLDGLLYNESDLEIEERYTDTHGYTDVNFAAFAMFGRRFCPRIRGVKNQRIYRINRDRDYGQWKHSQK